MFINRLDMVKHVFKELLGIILKMIYLNILKIMILNKQNQNLNFYSLVLLMKFKKINLFKSSFL